MDAERIMQPIREKVAYSYTRFSSPQQAEGDSLRRQIANAEAYAAQNGYSLDSSLRDEGISGYSGANLHHALGRFLAACESGAVESGSVLLIEAIDRLGRREFVDAFSVITQIINKNISIITLEDNNIYSRETLRENASLIWILVGKMQQAHGESKRKSDIVGAAWRNKKRLASVERKPLSKVCPAWLQLSQDRSEYVVIPDRVDIVRRIYNDTINGIGADKIARMLNANSVPEFDKKAQGIKGGKLPQGWRPSYIKKILMNRATVGEYQPSLKNTATNKKQVAVGEPIKGYYPAVIEMETWRAAQAAIASRRGTGGRKANRVANLASGLCYCVTCGGKMVLVSPGIRWKNAIKPRVSELDRAGDVLVCDRARRKQGCVAINRFKYAHVERMLLAGMVKMQEYEALSSKTPGTDDLANQIAMLDDQIAADKKRLADMTRQFSDLSAVAEVMQELMDKVRENTKARNDFAKKKLERIEIDQSWWDTVNAVLAKAGDYDFNTRTRLQAAMRRIYTRVDCDTLAGRATAHAAVGFSLCVLSDGLVDWFEFQFDVARIRFCFSKTGLVVEDGVTYKVSGASQLISNGAGQQFSLNQDGYIGNLMQRTGMDRALEPFGFGTSIEYTH